MNTHGWDVVYASSVELLNRVLAGSTTKLLPAFSFSDEKLQISFSGSFGPWAIQPGGSTNRIKLLVPIEEGKLAAPMFPSPIDLTGVQPVLNMALTLVEGTGSGTKDLKFDLRTNATQPSKQDGDVYVANPDESGLLKQRDPTGQAASVIHNWFGAPLVANKDKISYIFATVFTDPSDQPWLRPKATAVTYFESQAMQALAVQTLTQSPWGASGLSTGVDSSLLQTGADLFYALSKLVFMKNLLLPATAGALKVGAGSLRFNEPSKPSEQDDCSITNHGDISLPAVDHAGTHYYPKLTSFEVTVADDQIVTTNAGRFDITGLANAYVTFDDLRVVNEITYDASTRKIGFKLVSKTKPSTNSYIPWYEKSITWVIPLVGLIVNIIMKIVVATIESAVQDAISATGNLSVSDIQLDTAVWNGAEKFDVTEATLAQALVIRAKSGS